jgi:L-ascorbate metabolism protein UlaG (beta-lactamase superfamily)
MKRLLFVLATFCLSISIFAPVQAMQGSGTAARELLHASANNSPLMTTVVASMLSAGHFHQQKPLLKDGCYYNDEADTRNHLLDGPRITFEGIKNFLSYGLCNKDIWQEKQPIIVDSVDEPRITWLGHASFLIQMGGCNILTDPVFWAMPSYIRKVPVGIEPDKLPHISYVLISHNHRDHMDKASLQWLQAHHNPTFLVPIGTVLPLKKPKVIEKTWWQKEVTDTVHMTFLPARHWSCTNLFDYRKALWGSWMITYNNHSVYFAGDSAYGEHFKEIAEAFPSIDVALMPIAPGVPYEYTRHSHMDSQEAVKAFVDLHAHAFIPMHWGTFRMGGDAYEAPIENLIKAWEDSRDSLNGKEIVLLKFGGCWEKSHTN